MSHNHRGRDYRSSFARNEYVSYKDSENYQVSSFKPPKSINVDRYISAPSTFSDISGSSHHHGTTKAESFKNEFPSTSVSIFCTRVAVNRNSYLPIMRNFDDSNCIFVSYQYVLLIYKYSLVKSFQAVLNDKQDTIVLTGTLHSPNLPEFGLEEIGLKSHSPLDPTLLLPYSNIRHGSGSTFSKLIKFDYRLVKADRLLLETNINSTKALKEQPCSGSWPFNNTNSEFKYVSFMKDEVKLSPSK
eukprot:NODE_988_length_2511_cov_0.334163.p2 type:complete len:244 gc:universal NODE_988_length_2511_cov_0.334163:230-961(+)